MRNLTTSTRLRLYGTVFLITLGLLLSLTVAVYQQAFTPVVKVTLETDTTGNQLREQSDVKLRGMIVGEVRDVSADGEKAVLDLALKPEHVPLIPANVHARLLPKTLFGEKYVDLVVPGEPSPRHIRAGDVITQDRTEVGIELQKLMDDMLPLLRTVKPGKLNATLSAFATALEGRGEEIGDNLVRLEHYLSRLNPHMPALQENISRFADVVEIYEDAAPDLLRTMRNSITSSRTLVEKREALASLLTGTAAAADTGREFLAGNGDRIIRLGRVSRPTLALYARYSPVFPCLLEGLVEQNRRMEEAYRDGRMHITLEVAPQRPAYRPGEEPRYEDRSGPHCLGLPNPPVPAPDHGFKDGTSPDRHPGSAPPGLGHVSATEREQRLVGALVAPVMGVPADEVPDATTLLFGPMARGTEVSVA